MDKRQIEHFIDCMVGSKLIGVVGEKIVAPICPEMQSFVIGRLGKMTPIDGFDALTSSAKAAALAALLREAAEALSPTPQPTDIAALFPPDNVVQLLRAEGGIWMEVAAMRAVQIRQGYDAPHDDKHTHGELAAAAAAYASAFRLWYPWSNRANVSNKTERERAVTAAALLIAEVGRIDRAAEAAKGKPE